MRHLLLLLLPSLVVGCGTTWTPRDEDGDGTSILDGDCADLLEGGGDIGPHAAEIWYDGVDQNCDGLSDFDQDGDGFDAAGPGGGKDCWDDPNVVPEGFEALNGFPALTAVAVNPDMVEVYYDGVDANCDGASDFDQDLDGFDSANPDHLDAEGLAGDDCYDSVELDDYPGSGVLVGLEFEPVEVNPDATDDWYDGTDSNCDGKSDYDQDGDGYDLIDECDDMNAEISPDSAVLEIWYNDIDENCDGNRYDKDLDGFESAIDGPGTDCWDDFDSIPADFVAINGRTQPAADAVFPGADDAWYDAVDADCAGDSDFDQDLDGFDTSELPARSGSTGTDCLDLDAEAYLGATEIWYNGIDNDCDGLSDYDADRDTFDAEDEIDGGTDCDDSVALVNPGMNEDCATDFDDNCDAALDLRNADDCTLFYYDGDSDSYGTTTSECWCEAQPLTGYDATNSTDCDDASSSDHPGAVEIVANGNDEDCDGVDTCYTDADGDNYGTTVKIDGSSLNCTTGTGAPNDDDCNDADAGISPAGTEIAADSIDQDCDGVDTCYTDADGDNYGTTVQIDGSSLNCATGTGAPVSTDCDDTDAEVSPGEAEICNYIDDNCNLSIDEGLALYYTDADGDTFGSGAGDCSITSGIATSTDCDDGDAYVYPGAAELCDGGFNDCATAGSWTAASEDGVVTKVSTGGVPSNVTVGASLNLDATGSYYFCAGTYETLLVASSDTVSVFGFYGAANTIIDNGTADTSTVTVEDGSVTLDGLTITGGTGEGGYGGGVFASAVSDLAATVTLVDCVVEGNTALYGAGIAAVSSAWVVLDGTTVRDNAATDGGGIWIDEGEVTCTDGGVYANTATGLGGGVYIDHESGYFEATTCDFAGSADNTPDDVNAYDGTDHISYATYGATASFACALGLCAP